MDYEERISLQRSENRKFLRELGIYNENCENKQRLDVKPLKSSQTVKSPRIKNRVSKPTRRSSRLLGVEPIKYNDEIVDEIIENVQDFYLKAKSQPVKVKRENVFGAVPGVPVGMEFDTRLEASAAGVHRPTVAGIHGNPSLGCYSLALSGGYEDDVDLGDSFIYTGEGGRDLKGTKANPKNLRTAPQSKDQVLERGNLALSKNIENNVPVRVLRGYKLRSKFAPTEGYRYDGLYNVVEYYTTKGLSGFNVYKFRLERIKNQDPAPWLDNENEEVANP